MESRLLERLLRLLGPRGSRLASKGLEEAISLGGDVSRVYHRVAMLYRDYYGDIDFDGEPRSYYKEYPSARIVELPPPRDSSGVDVFRAMARRRSRRSYSSDPLTLEEVSTVLFYTVGITGRAWWGGPKRVYPSSGALQPVEAYVSASRVHGVEPGIYHYNPGRHVLEELARGDYSRELMDIALGQDHVGEAPMVMMLTVVYSRTLSKYGQRSYRYVHWDTGFAGENVYLACEALGLATVAVGAFYDEELCRLLDIDCIHEFPMLLFPIGRPR